MLNFLGILQIQLVLQPGAKTVSHVHQGDVCAGQSRQWPGARCQEALPAAFGLCDESDDYQYGASRSAKMTGLKVALPKGVTIDGRSFAPQLRGERGKPRDWVFTQLGDKRFARDHRFMLHEDGRLYDIKGDLFEKTDLSTSTDSATVAAKARLQAKQDEIQAKIEASQKETDAKVKSLQEQAAKESGERKAKREARIAQLQADQKRRSDLLKQAWELTKQALSA